MIGRFNHHAASADTPFVIEHLQLDRTGAASSGDAVHFTPAAKLIVTPSLRTQGLLSLLPDAEAKSLLLLLTFLRPEGRCEASVVEIAAALSISAGKARARMERLAAVRWRGKSVVHTFPRQPEGLDSFVLDAHVAEERAIAVGSSPPATRAEPPSSLRDAIIARSRQEYANPRAAVERQIAEQLGHAPVPVVAEAGPAGDARRGMAAAGLSQEQIDYLMDAFPLERIERQISWLPHRHARNPAKLLVAAIQHDYEPPAFVRLQWDIASEDSADSKNNDTDERADDPGGDIDLSTLDDQAIPLYGHGNDAQGQPGVQDGI